jgi:exodeoxyribonuclease VII large subunit
MESVPEEILTVSQLTQEIQEVLEGRIGSVWVEGEISNHRAQSSGHQYFTLKDAGAQISCVLFRGAASRLSTRLGDGMQVQLQGELGVYAPRGQYQLVVRMARAKGQGSLQARFEELKRRLQMEGLFDEAIKRPIPRIPAVVALVTSPTGAAVQDMLNILGRRAPWLRVLVYPVRVQGSGVEAETIEALRVLNRAGAYGLPKPDVIVIGRGGGSLEDLWAYNEEALARALRASKIPVISAVGHEVDFTIADFAADLRAPTPSAAAELLAPDAEELRRHFASCQQRMRRQVEVRLAHHDRVLRLMRGGALHHAMIRRLEREQQRVDEMEVHLREAVRARLQRAKDRLAQVRKGLQPGAPLLRLQKSQHRVQSLGTALEQAVNQRLERLRALLEAKAALLRTLGPAGVLARGFTYVTDAEGRPLTRSAGVPPGRRLSVHFQDGTLPVEVRQS